MNQTATVFPRDMTASELGERFGPMPLSRICFDPFPGSGTEQDVKDRLLRENRLFELVDGILIEKAMGFPESFLACVLIQVLRNWLAEHKLGIVVGADGIMRLAPGLIRIPDVSFISWDRLPQR